jgi:hypothetical protein
MGDLKRTRRRPRLPDEPEVIEPDKPEDIDTDFGLPDDPATESQEGTDARPAGDVDVMALERFAGFTFDRGDADDPAGLLIGLADRRSFRYARRGHPGRWSYAGSREIVHLLTS